MTAEAVLCAVIAEQANAPFLDRISELLDNFVVPSRKLCNLKVVLVQPQRGGTAFSTDIGAQRR